MSKHPEVLDYWHGLVENFSTSPLDFYDLVKAGIAKRALPDLAISSVEWRESGIGSGKRTYLRVSREHMNFDVCAAPFGTGFFFSWWLAKIRRPFLDIAVLFLIFLVGMLLGKIYASGGEEGMPPEPISLTARIVLYLVVLLGAGAFVRYGNRGLEPFVLSLPITGFLYGLIFRPQTYFNEDTAIVFRESVHKAVLEAIDEVTTAQGVRGIPEEARRLTSMGSPKLR